MEISKKALLPMAALSLLGLGEVQANSSLSEVLRASNIVPVEEQASIEDNTNIQNLCLDLLPTEAQVVEESTGVNCGCGSGGTCNGSC